MKKILLSALMLVGFAGFAQDHVQTTTGFTNNCENFSESGVYAFSDYESEDWTGTNYGGFNDVAAAQMKYTYSLDIGTSYSWLGLTTNVNLTAPNNKIAFDFSAFGIGGADTSITITVKLEKTGGDLASETFTATQVSNHYEIVFDAPTDDLALTNKVTFQISSPGTGNRRIGSYLISNIQAGSLVTSTSVASSLVSSSKLFPNPTSDDANIELNLKSNSDVKVTLSDMMGKEVMTIAEGSMSSLNKSFSVTNLQKGVYTVNYTVNGSPAKAELLMVK